MSTDRLIHQLRSVRIGLALILTLFAAASSWATDYITDVMVLGGDKSTVSEMKLEYEQKGWIFIDDDLNDGAGGDYVHVLYKKSSGYSSNVITDIIIKTGEHPDSYIFNGRTYYRAPHDGSEYFKSYGGNLNSGTTVSSSTNMWLYYTKEEFPDKRAVSGIAFTVADDNKTKIMEGYTTLGRNGAVVGSDGSGALDLNEGAGSDSKYIYMHISTVQSVLAGALKYISDVVVFGGEKDDVNAQKERYASQGWVVIDQDLNDGAGSGTDYVYLAYKKSPLSEDGNGFITDFIIKTDDYPDTYEFNGRTYYRAPNFGSEHFEAHGGNLNSGTRSSSTNMRLYFTREKFSDNRVVDDIAFTTGEDNKTKNGYTTLGKDGAAVGSDGSGALDLNEGVGYTSDYIYMHYATTLKSLDVVDLAALTGDYVATDGKILTGTLGGNYKISIANGATVTLKNALIDGHKYPDSKWAGLTCEGDCKIVLAEGSVNFVTAFYKDYPGIFVPEGYTLTIEGSGRLDVYGTILSAGIGGGYNISCGNIVINGGTVNAMGGNGVGGGYTDGGTTTVGNITINGGTIVAMGAGNGAGIGGGYTYNSGTATVGNITINGGTVTATGGTDGAGIGGGHTIGGKTTVGDITINGGTVTATGGDYGAGIGGGYTESGTATVGDITINGGTVTATGGKYGAGIGGGYIYNNGRTTVGDITIQGCTVTATGGGNGAGIGSGYTNGGTITVGDITIQGCTVTATGGTGIGGDYTTNGGTTTVGNIIIQGSTVNATGGTDGAGIGGGYIYKGTTTVGDITIQGGTVIATGGKFGAGIGSGNNYDVARTTVGDITINGGLVTAKGFVGIGKGDYYLKEDRVKVEIGSIRLYHGFKEIAATITENPIYMYGETDVSGNPNEYFAIDGSVTRSLIAVQIDKKIVNGKIQVVETPSKGKFFVDEIVSLDATPDFGYKFESFHVKDASKNDITVDNGKFVVPSSDVTVSADFASKYPMLTFSENGRKVTVNGTYGGTEAFELDEDIRVESAVLDRNFAVTDESSDKRARSTITLPFDIAAEYVTGLSRVLAFKKVGPYTDRETGKEKTAMFVSYVWCAKGYGAENCPESDVVLEAYRPYIVELEDDLTKISLTGPVTLKKTAGVNTDSRSGDWVFRGMLRYKKWDETADKAQLTGCNGKSCIYGYAASGDKNILGQFVRIAAGAYIYPFRAYLGYEPEEQQPVQAVAPANASYVLRPDVHVRGEEIPENMDVVVDDGDGETTVIGQFNTRTGEFRMNGAATRRTFDAKGRNVGDKANKARGAYYGKKVLK